MIESLVSPLNISNMIAMARATPPAGAFIEVGVYKGGTAWHLDRLAKEQGRACFLYDTFKGIPYSSVDDHHQIGDFGDVDFEEVKNQMTVSAVIKGIFPASAVVMGRVAFVHLDCDQYQSIIDACHYLQPLMMAGGVMWFDDSPVLAGAEKAVMELYGDRVQEFNGKHFVMF